MSTPAFRIAVRTVSTGADTADVVFYLAEPDRMEGAEELARFRKYVLTSAPGLFEKVLEGIQESLGDIIEERTGIRPGWKRQEPLEPREGKA